MRCKTCDYPLWNLPSRTCPECGRPFLPSEYEFVPNSVRFCCPFCAQAYYGTGEKGHLVPSEFACVTCGKPVRMDEMILLPTEGVEEKQTLVDVIPWLDRSRRLFITRWIGTIWMVITGPGRLARALPGDSRGGRAFFFAVITLTAYALLAGTVILLMPILFAPAGRSLLGLSWLALMPVGVVLIVLLWALLTHGLLRLTGKTEGGLGRTLICISYASAANILAAIPCLGFYLAFLSWIWWAIVAAVMLVVTQRVSALRAACAAIAPPLIACAGLVALVIFAVSSGISSVTTMAMAARQTAAAAKAPASVSSIAAGLKAYTAENGAAPPHALALLLGNHVQLSDLFWQGLPTTPADSTVAGVDLVTAMTMRPAEQDAALSRAAKSLGPSPVAHRLGDMVFIYHGIDLSSGSTADPGLWLVIDAPVPALRSLSTPAPPGASPGAPPGTPPAPGTPRTPGLPGSPSTAPAPIVVGTLGNGVKSIPAAQWKTALDAQNTLRAAAGLPPLPDPATVQQ